MLLGLLIFTLRWSELAALLVAAAFHELGHWFCLKWMHVPIYGISVSLSGPVLCCGEPSSRSEQVIAALSGPLAGLLLWITFSVPWPLCAELSLYLSLFNLLPVLPLDGGRAIFAATQSLRLVRITGALTVVVTVVFGLYVLYKGYGLGVVLFGVWLMMLACQGSGNDVK